MPASKALYHIVERVCQPFLEFQDWEGEAPAEPAGQSQFIQEKSQWLAGVLGSQRPPRLGRSLALPIRQETRPDSRDSKNGWHTLWQMWRAGLLSGNLPAPFVDRGDADAFFHFHPQ